MGEERRGEMRGESHMDTYTTMCKPASQQMGMCCVALYQPEGWDGEGVGRGVQEGEDICIPMADSC